jgi:uncharacterized OsmC-like protein
MPRIVSVSSGTLRDAQTISIGPHVLQSDEPADVGGDDMGPTAQELIMASLGACANIHSTVSGALKHLEFKVIRTKRRNRKCLRKGLQYSAHCVGEQLTNDARGNE